MHFLLVSPDYLAEFGTPKTQLGLKHHHGLFYSRSNQDICVAILTPQSAYCTVNVQETINLGWKNGAAGKVDIFRLIEKESSGFSELFADCNPQKTPPLFYPSPFNKRSKSLSKC